MPALCHKQQLMFRVAIPFCMNSPQAPCNDSGHSSHIPADLRQISNPIEAPGDLGHADASPSRRPNAHLVAACRKAHTAHVSRTSQTCLEESASHMVNVISNNEESGSHVIGRAMAPLEKAMKALDKAWFESSLYGFHRPTSRKPPR